MGRFLRATPATSRLIVDNRGLKERIARWIVPKVFIAIGLLALLYLAAHGAFVGS